MSATTPASAAVVRNQGVCGAEGLLLAACVVECRRVIGRDSSRGAMSAADQGSSAGALVQLAAGMAVSDDSPKAAVASAKTGISRAIRGTMHFIREVVRYGRRPFC